MNEHATRGTVPGRAADPFHAIMAVESSVEDVQLLHRRCIATTDGDKSWRKTAEATDAGNSELGEAERTQVSSAFAVKSRTDAKLSD